MKSSCNCLVILVKILSLGIFRTCRYHLLNDYRLLYSLHCFINICFKKRLSRNSTLNVIHSIIGEMPEEMLHIVIRSIVEAKWNIDMMMPFWYIAIKYKYFLFGSSVFGDVSTLIIKNRAYGNTLLLIASNKRRMHCRAAASWWISWPDSCQPRYAPRNDSLTARDDI